MINIVADSTVYRADPRREKAAFKALARLASGGLVTLHIPEIVRREFLSQEEELHEKNVKAILGAVHGLGRRPLDAAVAAEVKKIGDDTSGLVANLKTAAAKEFTDWVRSISAAEHPLDSSHGGKMLESYFGGTAPFKQKKNRNDIPDAFVWQSIQDLAREHKPLYVVSGDGGLRQPFEGSRDFVVFASLEDLIASAPIQALLKQHNVSANLIALLALLPAQTALIASEIESELVDELAGKTVGDHDSEPTISMVDKPEDIEVDVTEAVDHGGGLAVVPFKAKVECLVEFGIDKSDYYAMSGEESEGISISDLNDHRFLAEKYNTVCVEGSLSVQINPEKLRAEHVGPALLDALKDGEISIDSIYELEFEHGLQGIGQDQGYG